MTFQGERSQDLSRVHRLVRTPCTASCLGNDSGAVKGSERSSEESIIGCKRDCLRRLRMRDTPSRDCNVSCQHQMARYKYNTNPLYVCLEPCQAVIFDSFSETPSESGHNPGFSHLQRFPEWSS